LLSIFPLGTSITHRQVGSNNGGCKGNRWLPKLVENGAHVHIYTTKPSQLNSFKNNPLDAVYAVVEYVSGNLRSRYMEIAEKYEATKLSIQNEMDLQRVFTCPLSLHCSLNLTAMCFSPDMINDFCPLLGLCRPLPSLEGVGRIRGWRSRSPSRESLSKSSELPSERFLGLLSERESQRLN